MTSSSELLINGRNSREIVGIGFALHARMCIGRLLAYCVHPTAAWRRVSTRDRALIVATYVGTGYLATLVTLLTL